MDFGEGHTNSKVAHSDACRRRIYKEFRRANGDNWAKEQHETERQPKAAVSSTPAPADVDLDAADFDGDQPPTKKTRVDNSRATHGPHEIFEGKTWQEYAAAQLADGMSGFAVGCAARTTFEAEFRAAAQQERDKAGWAEPPGPRRFRVPSDRPANDFQHGEDDGYGGGLGPEQDYGVNSPLGDNNP